VGRSLGDSLRSLAEGRRGRGWLLRGGLVLVLIPPLGCAAAMLAAGTWMAFAALGLCYRVARYALRAATFRLHKRCPDCAERVRADARVCRHCGYRFAPR
jgi:Uncharacterised protein family UPF0547